MYKQRFGAKDAAGDPQPQMYKPRAEPNLAACVHPYHPDVMKFPSLVFGLGLAVSLVLGLVAACGSDPVAIPCGQIPANGCPLRGGGTCDDPFCGAIYSCVDGTWTFVETCSNPPIEDAGTNLDGCVVATIDHTGETTGCKPDLQNPDCPVQAAEQCASSVCQSECVDFFLCTADGWQVVAYCDQDGQLVVMP